MSTNRQQLIREFGELFEELKTLKPPTMRDWNSEDDLKRIKRLKEVIGRLNDISESLFEEV